METDKKFHIIRNGQQMAVSPEELEEMNKSNDSIELDVQWYLAHGYVTAEEFEKRHQYDGNK